MEYRILMIKPDLTIEWTTVRYDREYAYRLFAAYIRMRPRCVQLFEVDYKTGIMKRLDEHIDEHEMKLEPSVTKEVVA